MTKQLPATSKPPYPNVQRRPDGRYQVIVAVNGRHIYGGVWHDQRDAAVARDRFVLHLKQEATRGLCFPTKSRRLGPASAPELCALARRDRKRASAYFGVNRDRTKQRWFVQMPTEQGQRRLIFCTERAAAEAYDRWLLHQGLALPRNFPDRALEPMSWVQLQQLARQDRAAARALGSRHRGVYWDASRGLWAATIRFNGMSRSLGRFERERDAARAYDLAAWNVTGSAARLNFAPPKTRPTGELPQTRERTKTSRYRGVSRNASGYSASVTVAGKLRYLGTWKKDRDAAIAVDRALLWLGQPQDLNLPKQSSELGPARPEVLRRLARMTRTKEASSRYLGVLRNGGGWIAAVQVNKRMFRVGRWESEEDAAVARDRLWLWQGCDRTLLNFPKRRLQPATLEQLRVECEAARKARTTSRYRGVCLERRSGLWRACITHHYEEHYLGKFEIEEEAAEAYDRAAKRLHKKKAKLNFPD